MKKAVVKNIVLKVNKMSTGTDEWTAVNGKTVLVCLSTPVGEFRDP